MTVAGQTPSRPRQPRVAYTAAQIDKVLAFKGSAADAAATVGVSRNTAETWRNGELPAFYAEAKRVERQAKLQQRAARFLRSQDARAGR